MRWLLAVLAPAVLAAILWTTKLAHPAIIGYHVVCAVGIILARRRLRPLFQWTSTTRAWIVGTTLVFVAVLWAPRLFWDPRTIRTSAAAALFPWKNVDLTLVVFVVYTMVLHCPLEEIFWRGVVLNPNGRLSVEIAANAALFYLVHVAALTITLGALGWLLAIPAGLAAVGWSFVTLRSRSLWPALISHWAVDAAILWGMWYYFARG
jgi:membrane protease YdiL (CAAX protease family)